jgi:hypothetical protein
MNKGKLIVVLLSVFVISPVVAEKPEWAGKGKPTVEQKEAHRAVMEAKVEEVEDEGRELEKMESSKKGLEKQREKKLSQEQKELDKGSEKGKEQRQKRKKWWKFWE